MHFLESLANTLGRTPTTFDVAQDVADRISAMEQLRRIAREDGDIQLLDDATKQILDLRALARSHGFTTDEYPGLFR